MGNNPVPPPPITNLPIKEDPRLWGDGYVEELSERMRQRGSLLAYRRRRAYAACLRVIEWREADLWPDI